MTGRSRDDIQDRELSDQELIEKFLKDTTLFLGPDPEIMQHHDLMPRIDFEEACIASVNDPHTLARIRERIQAGADEGFEIIEQMGAAPGAKWGDIIMGVYSVSGDLAIASVGGLVLFAATTPHPIKYIRKYWIDEPTVGVREGDAFLMNDPRYGSIHAADQSMILPVFWEGQLVCWVAATVHEGENGAMEPGGMPTMAESPYDEGLRMSPFKAVENYEIKRDILTVLQNSVREPKLQYEDMKVKLFACLRMKQRIEETLKTDGPEALVSTLRLTMENIRSEVRRRISEWPDMTMRTYMVLDSTLRENCLIKINLQMIKKGDRLILDFRGSSPEFTNRPNNAVLAVLKGMLSQLFLSFVWPDLPRSQAVFAPIEVVTDPNSITGCSDGVPSAHPMAPMFAAFAAVQLGVAKISYSCPQKFTRVVAPWFNQLNTFIFGGITQHGETVGNLCADINGQSGGARAGFDGEHSMVPIFGTMSDLGEQELNEEELPFLQLVSKKITMDTQAPGKYRGGQGYQMIVATKDSETWGFMTAAAGAKFPPNQGLFGGYACGTYPLCKVKGVDVYEVLKDAPEKFRHSIADIMNERPFEGATYSSHHMGMGFELSKRGELFMISQGAGAGYGDYLERAPEAIMRDVEDALISRAFARDFYKVVFDDDSLAVDEDATRDKRNAEREARKKRGVPYAEFAKRWTRSEPPEHLPYYGSWGDDNSVLYVGGKHDKRDAKDPSPVFMPNPKDVRIAELEERNAELEAQLDELTNKPR